MKYIDDNMTDLYTIAMLPEGVKLSIRHGRLVHDPSKSGEGVMAFISGTFNAVKRWYNNDNRATAVNEVYSVIQTAFKVIETADQDLVSRYQQVFPLVIQGIENYSRTYGTDTSITARCKILVDNLKSVSKKEKNI